MNIQHLRYAVEVARLGSINKAAEALYIGQPNLSRAIKELENYLGISIFARSARGMEPTVEGADFLQRAQQILDQIDQVEQFYRGKTPHKQRFSVLAPRSSYISEAFASFCQALPQQPAELYCHRATAAQVLAKAIQGEFRLAIVRCSDLYLSQLQALLTEKGLSWQEIFAYVPQLTVSRQSPLCQGAPQELSSYLAIIQGDAYVPPAKREELPEGDRRAYVSGRDAQLTLLAACPQAYLWAEPMAKALLNAHGLVQLPGSGGMYRDLLVYRSGYRFTDLDQAFVAQMEKTVAALG